MHEPAIHPNDLERFFVERANAGDLEGLVALYEPGAVIDNGTGDVASGHEEIRSLLTRFLASRPRLTPGIQAEPLMSGDIALTSSRLQDGDITAEIARRQPDGTWLWLVDRFSVVKGWT